MPCKESKTQVRPRDSKVNGARIAANQLHLPLVRFKLVNRQVESVSSASKSKIPGQPRWRRSLRSRNGKPRCLNRHRAASPLRVANQRNNRWRHSAVRKLPGPMLLRAHATPAPLRCPASAAPLANNARPVPEIIALRVEQVFSVEGSSEVVVGGGGGGRSGGGGGGRRR